MSGIVYLQNNQAITTSRLVAEKFNKNHYHVVRTINELVRGLSNFGDTPLFESTTYYNEQNGQEYPMYYMNRDGFALLVMGFTGKKALQFKLDFIEAFNEMEQKIRDGLRPDVSALSMEEIGHLLIEKGKELKTAKQRIAELESVVNDPNVRMTRLENKVDRRLSELEDLVRGSIRAELIMKAEEGLGV